MSMIHKIAHFEGADKTGKDTLRDIIVKDSKGAYLIYVRSYISQIVYSRIYKRQIDEYFFWKRLKEDFDKGDRFFYFECDLVSAKKRFEEHNEQDLSINDYELHQKTFQDVIQECLRHGIYVHQINTTSNSIEECCEMIKKSLNSR